MQAVAKAVAIAVADITAECFVKGKDSFACAIADVDVRAVATVRSAPL